MRKFKRASLGSFIKKVKSECFATLSAIKDSKGKATCPYFFRGDVMDNIKMYEVNAKYINYLLPQIPHLFHNKQSGQQNNRKYIGIIISVNGMNYFAPLSSFKDKHKVMKESLDFIKIKNYAVINLNNMLPIPEGSYSYVDISKEKNLQYRHLLLAEYRYIKGIQNKIRKNADILYKLKINEKELTALTKRCNDFKKLEELCKCYSK